MKALVAPDYGISRLTVADRPVPSPGPGQLLCRVEAAALNPFDLRLVAGALRGRVPAHFPFVIGMDVAGTVEAVGDGVTSFAAGDPVIAVTRPDEGTIAEYALVDEGPAVCLRPDGLDAIRGAALPESGLTALDLLRAVDGGVTSPLAWSRHPGLGPVGSEAAGAGSKEEHLRVSAGRAGWEASGGTKEDHYRASSGRAPLHGRRLLVIGATGGIGQFIVQLAADLGAWVIATATPDDVRYVRVLGASSVIDYTAGDVPGAALRIAPDGVDLAVDLVDAGPDLRPVARAVRPGGRIVSPLDGPADFGHGVTGRYIGTFQARPGELAHLAARVANGRLSVEVGACYPLAEAPRAVVDYATEHIRGKIVIRI
ncbi:NADP-dependent oxidoreductase [Frankia sp. CNm7]|uniref:NADP-dependent oxidoreductase n=1 Tax=Frankia nepalensis TaxID=1836974 RepID=A0A937R9J7_9ACTN|nr:NADP-dependent oxidoreductase [Frankia nepalensis]MBL7499906.1 NADP-dependent oxidoreductase [Frankia nepalensis]MBL7516006.1 NADP-dependent oxidoreductase [Frankia nepalensis]MBL7517866.1 NADP-dependent oxidoreductase [Frankia nepalensis]MBL7625632.1 NADP-dependent oxidoreductase [Frankia nepalensis]